MNLSPVNFEPISVTIGRYSVTWVFQNEGRNGAHYNPLDHNDQPLLRFVCQARDSVGLVRPLPHASYLTGLPTLTNTDQLLLAAKRLIEILRDTIEDAADPFVYNPLYPYRDALLLFSHISPDNFELHPPVASWPREAISAANSMKG